MTYFLISYLFLQLINDKLQCFKIFVLPKIFSIDTISFIQ